jgi:CRP-like cAMP-binding protein
MERRRRGYAAPVTGTDAGELRTNTLLDRLPGSEFERLRPLLVAVDAGLRDQVYEPDGPIPAVYFPLTAVYSMVAVGDGPAAVEVGTIGREGLVGLPLFLGAASSPNAAFCQVPGRAAVLTAGDLRRFLARDGELHRLLHRYTQTMMVQMAQNVVCNAAHPVVQRAARWLLTTGDRVRHDEFPMTQEFLGQMLGVRRPTVSEVAGRLQAEGLIRCARGRVVLVDRSALERVTCTCYRIVRAEFDLAAGA